MKANQAVFPIATRCRLLGVSSSGYDAWTMANHLRTELTRAALTMALAQRRPKDVMHHADQGSQYPSVAFGLRCQPMRVRPSMGSVGDCFDHALAERFFATLECELLDRSRFGTHEPGE